MPDWLQRYIPEGWSERDLVIAGLVLTVATMVLSVLFVGIVIVRIPADYFSSHRTQQVWADRHPLIRWPLRLLKNLFGLFLVVLGLILSVPGVPGQGILTVLIGAMLIDFPGKRRAERWLLGRRGVLNSINRVRARYGRAPLQLDGPAAES